MLTRMTERDWALVLEVFRGCLSRRGDKGYEPEELAIFDRRRPAPRPPESGFVTDFLNVRTGVWSLWEEVRPHPGGQRLDVPIPGDAYHGSYPKQSEARKAAKEEAEKLRALGYSVAVEPTRNKPGAR